MPRARLLRLLLASALLTTACSRDGDGGGRRDARSRSASTSSTGTTERGAIAPSSIPQTGECEGTKTVRTEATFVAEGKLLAAKVDGTGLRCLATVGDVPAEAAFEWARNGERALIGNRVVGGAAAADISGLVGRAVELSDPTGQSVLSIDDAGKLFKQRPGGPPADISFLTRHTDAVYHPAGHHVVAAGTDRDGAIGVWIAKNDGTGAVRAVRGETAEAISSLGWTSAGLLTFVADHGATSHVHLIELSFGSLVALPADRREPGVVVPSAFEPNKVAVTDGPCGRQTTRVATWPKNGSPDKAQHVSLGPVLGKLATEPVGWLDDGTLLVLVRASGCTGPASLWAWHPERTDVEIARDVHVAAVRGALPEPPEPPASVPDDAPA